MILRPRFYGELYADSFGEWRWRVRSRNGNAVADSAEGYRNRGDCRRMFRALHPLMQLRELARTR